MHSFTIDSDAVRILVMVAPAGVPYGEIQKMMAVAPTYGFEFVPPKH